VQAKEAFEFSVNPSINQNPAVKVEGNKPAYQQYSK
jgi:hypothetical protein